MVKIAFIQSHPYPYLGVMHLSSIAKKYGHKTEVFITSLEKDIVKKVCKYNPKIIGFSCTTQDYSYFLDLAEKIKKNTDLITLFGGPHPTFNPEIINEKPIDIICIGEGEIALSNLLKTLKHKKGITKIKNLWIKKERKIYKNDLNPLIANLNSLPFPDKNIYKKYPLLNEFCHPITGRGCLSKCSYCFNESYNQLYNCKNSIRKRHIKNVIQELKNYRTKVLRFSDDNFLINPEWTNNFLKIYKSQIKKPFSCLIWPLGVREDLIKLLKESGCFIVGWGIESGDENIRKKILNRNISDAQILNLAKLLHKNKLKFNTYNLCGIPTETEKEYLKTLELNRKSKPHCTNMAILKIYEKTRISKIYSNKKKDGKTKNFVQLFSLFTALPIPLSLVKKIIRFPPNPVFSFIKQISLANRLKKTYKLNTFFFIKFMIFCLIKLGKIKPKKF